MGARLTAIKLSILIADAARLVMGKALFLAAQGYSPPPQRQGADHD